MRNRRPSKGLLVARLIYTKLIEPRKYVVPYETNIEYMEELFSPDSLSFKGCNMARVPRKIFTSMLEEALLIRPEYQERDFPDDIELYYDAMVGWNGKVSGLISDANQVSETNKNGELDETFRTMAKNGEFILIIYGETYYKTEPHEMAIKEEKRIMKKAAKLQYKQLAFAAEKVEQNLPAQDYIKLQEKMPLLVQATSSLLAITNVANKELAKIETRP